MQQAAVGAVGCWCLGNKLGGQIVIELRKIQISGHVKGSKVGALGVRN